MRPVSFEVDRTVVCSIQNMKNETPQAQAVLAVDGEYCIEAARMLRMINAPWQPGPRHPPRDPRPTACVQVRLFNCGVSGGWCLPSLRATSSQPPSFQVRSVGQAVSVLRQRPHPGCFVIGQSSAFVGRGFPGAFAFTASHPVPPALHLICFAL